MLQFCAKMAANQVMQFAGNFIWRCMLFEDITVRYLGVSAGIQIALLNFAEGCGDSTQDVKHDWAAFFPALLLCHSLSSWAASFHTSQECWSLFFFSGEMMDKRFCEDQNTFQNELHALPICMGWHREGNGMCWLHTYPHLLQWSLLLREIKLSFPWKKKWHWFNCTKLWFYWWELTFCDCPFTATTLTNLAQLTVYA